MTLIIFIIVIMFLFSFFGVIGLLVRTDKQAGQINQLTKQLRDLVVSGSFSQQPQSREAPSVPAPTPVPEPAPVKLEPVIIKHEVPVPITEKPAVIIKPSDSPSWFEPVKKFIHGGNLWAAGGVILLITAFGMLIAFLASRGFFTVEMGIAAAAVCGTLMMVFGWRFKARRPIYFLLLQGGGTGILYLSVFAAHKLTPYFPAAVSLILLTILVAPAVVLALLQNAQALALLGFLGGFAAPILLSSGEGNYIFLFSYYTILNSAILFISFRRLWKWLGATAFLCTFGVLIFWVLTRYAPSMYLSVQPFSFGFIIIFTMIGILYLKDREISYPNISLIAGTPILGMIIQWNLVSHIQFGQAINSIVFSLFYLVLVRLIWKRFGKQIRPVAEGYLAIAVILANIAIPLELSKEITSAIWAAEGIVLLLLGLRLANVQFQIWGFVIHIAGAIAFGIKNNNLNYYLDYLNTNNAFMNPQFIGSIIIALSAIVMVLLLNHHKFKNVVIIKLFTIWALVWWFSGWIYELNRITLINLWNSSWGYFLIAGSLSAALFYGIARYFRYTWLNIAIFPSIITAIILVYKTFFSQIFDSLFSSSSIKIITYNFFYDEYALGWILFFTVNILLIILMRRKAEKDTIPLQLHAAWLFTVILVMLYVLTSSARASTIRLNLAISWTSLAGILPSLIILFGVTFLTQRFTNITAIFKNLFFFVLPMLLSLALGLWFIVTLFSSGKPDPLPYYIPFINPLDLQQGFCIIGITLWFIHNRNKSPWMSDKLFALTDIMIFLWITAIIARCVHFYANVPMYAMWGSSIYHLGIFIFWALYGIIHMIAGHKKAMRPIWIAGAVLVVVDIAKLLLFDLAGTGAISRIVSFFIAGVILLLIGWVVPLPPSKTKVKHEN